MTQTYITLNDGNKIPQFGLGVYQIPEGEATINSVKTALEMGVRHIDTAHAYQNERTEDEMNEIRKLDSGKRFFNMTLEQQEQMLGSWKPED